MIQPVDQKRTTATHNTCWNLENFLNTSRERFLLVVRAGRASLHGRVHTKWLAGHLLTEEKWNCIRLRTDIWLKLFITLREHKTEIRRKELFVFECLGQLMTKNLKRQLNHFNESVELSIPLFVLEPSNNNVILNSSCESGRQSTIPGRLLDDFVGQKMFLVTSHVEFSVGHAAGWKSDCEPL